MIPAGKMDLATKSRDRQSGYSTLDTGGQLAYECWRVTVWKRRKFILLFLAC